MRAIEVLIITGVLLAAATGRADQQAFDGGMRKILAVYLKIHKPLTEDAHKGTAPLARTIATLAGKLNTRKLSGKHVKHLKTIPAKIKKAALALHRARGLEPKRKAFKKLSLPLVLWATLTKPKGIWIIYCSMTKGSWLQVTRGIRNPYHGTRMLYCGQIVWPRKSRQDR